MRLFHLAAFGLIFTLAMFTLFYTLGSAVGVTPWLEFTARFGDFTVPLAGMLTQILVTAILVALVFFLPASARVLRLERAHRAFEIKMEDVARAYHLCHTADRSGVFTLSSEFDSVRERLAYLRDHPELEHLEADVLEIAAQMSQQSRRLADVYNEEKVARAKAFLKQRQEEVERQQARIVEALHACTEIRKWAQQVELEESVVASQLAQLDEQLAACLPALGYSLEGQEPETGAETGTDTNVVLMKPAAE